ncbi:MAG: rnhA [Flaviaesturariibacter sp.]|nr:rnhA [Flaviaesturariibacter sp.]
MSDDSVIMYTDGSSRGNPGPGGYGVVMMHGRLRKELSRGYRLTTNNRMELMAVIAGLETMKRTDLPITVYSDSQYVVKAVTQGWLKKWLATNFAGGKKNKDLWKRFAALAANYRLNFVWVKGHATNPHNNRCDELATEAADGTHLIRDDGYEDDPDRN